MSAPRPAIDVLRDIVAAMEPTHRRSGSTLPLREAAQRLVAAGARGPAAALQLAEALATLDAYAVLDAAGSSP
jgi:hypothetical protein